MLIYGKDMPGRVLEITGGKKKHSYPFVFLPNIKDAAVLKYFFRGGVGRGVVLFV